MYQNFKTIKINEFLDIEFKLCFVCGNKKYSEFYVNNHLYRVCTKCLKKQKTIQFFKDMVEQL